MFKLFADDTNVFVSDTSSADTTA